MKFDIDKTRPARGAETLPSKTRLKTIELLSRSIKIWLGQGEFAISSDPAQVVSTVLGSCIAVCMRDPAIGVGGMNHFLLPEAPYAPEGLPSLELRYGSYSIERLINAILSRGGRRERLEIKVFGGSNVLGAFNIGHHNADFVEAYLMKEGLPVAAKDLRGTSPRKVHYFPTTGRVLMSHPKDPASATIFRVENSSRFRQQVDASLDDVEIFSEPTGARRRKAQR